MLVGRKMMVMSAIRIINFESTFKVLESLCVTRLKERLMRLLMRLSRLVSRNCVAWTAVRLYEISSCDDG